MPKTTPNAIKREWLKLYDEGKSYADIAKMEEGKPKNIKTVREGIEAARREQWVNLAQAEMYKEALFKHQNILLVAVNDLISALVVPGPETRENLHGPISGGMVSYDPKEGLIVSLDVESKPEWVLLREHLKRHKLWKTLKTWETDLLAYLMCLDGLKKAVADIVTNYEMLPGFAGMKYRGVDNWPYVNKKNLGEVLYRIGVNRAITPEQSLELDKNISVLYENVLFGSKKILTIIGAPDELLEQCGQECRQALLDLLTAFSSFNKNKHKPEVKKSSVYSTIKPDLVKFQGKVVLMSSSYASLNKSTEEEIRIAQDIVLLGMIPGNCHVCNQLGV